MAIQVSNEEEFRRLLRALSLELVDANISFKMHTKLIAAGEADQMATMNEAWTFWSLTIQAHIDSAIFRLCRIFDQDDTNLGLRGLLDTIRANQHLFSKKFFVARMQSLPDPESSYEALDLARLETDMRYATRNTNDVVDRLIKIRHNYYSHRNASDVVADRNVSETYPHMRDEVGDLLDGGLAIVNRYSALFDMNVWSSKIVGSDDYHYVLRAAKERLDRIIDERGSM